MRQEIGLLQDALQEDGGDTGSWPQAAAAAARLPPSELGWVRLSLNLDSQQLITLGYWVV